jgi:hypothetical protein
VWVTGLAAQYTLTVGHNAGQNTEGKESGEDKEAEKREKEEG